MIKEKDMKSRAGMLLVYLVAVSTALAHASQLPRAAVQNKEQDAKHEQEIKRQQEAQREARPPADPFAGAQPVNIRLDVSIVDQSATSASQPKTLMLMLADRSSNSVRAPFEDRAVNIDAKPTIVDGRIRLSLTVVVNLRKVPDNSTGNTGSWSQTQMMTTMLDSGKPMVLMETTDPAFNNRKMTVEVKATVVK
jgi:hypothetical protein